MRIRLLIAMTVLATPAVSRAQTPALIEMVGKYVSTYGEKSAVVVATETYTQIVTVEGAADAIRPRKLVAEFAIVKTEGGIWTGFRDVLEVNGEKVRDRRDRLEALLTSQAASLSEATRIANESSRYNVGPVSRNFNTPTTALFFFLPQNLERFTFTSKGAKKIDGVDTTELAFKETRVPTLITTRSGRNVPLEGSLWVMADGTVIRTRIRMEKFADMEGAVSQTSPRVSGPLNPASNNGGRPSGANVAGMETKQIDSSADIEVTYRKPPGIDLWLPAQMNELYEGPIDVGVRPTSARSSTKATYGGFKQFGASGKIVQ